jgi:hypothetical protein
LHTLATPARSASVPGRALATLAALVAVLAAAFVVAPPRLAASGPAADLADQGHLVAAFRTAVVGYWHSGDRNYPPALQHVVDYWFRFHLIKGGIAALLLIVLGALTVLLWRTFLRADGLGTGSRAALVSAGTAAPMLALSALAVVMANLQGAMAPFAFARYHAALAVIAAVVVVALLSLSVMFWRSFARVGSTDRRTRRVLGWFGVFSSLSSLIVAVLVVANTGTATDPAPALLALFNGGF